MISLSDYGEHGEGTYVNLTYLYSRSLICISWKPAGIPTNTGRLSNIVSMLGHGLQLWPSVKTTLGDHLAFTEM